MNKMEKYKVRSGSLNVTVEARNHKIAVFKAIEENNVKSFGLLIGCLKHGDPKDEELFSQTEGVLKEMGFDVLMEKKDVEKIKLKVKQETDKYVEFMQKQGYSVLIKETLRVDTGELEGLELKIVISNK